MRRFALLSPQGTACPESVLYDEEYTEAMRLKIEARFCDSKPDSPVANTWTNVTSNEACE